MSSSLDGIRVLDLSRLAAGNMISHMLADHGADVIKVERPEKGDDLRTWKVNKFRTGGMFIQEIKEAYH